MLGRVRSVRRNRHISAIVGFAACVLAAIILKGAVLDSETDNAVNDFWRGVLAKDLVSVTARMSTDADIDADALIAKYSGYMYEGVVKSAVKIQRDVAVVPVELKSPSGYVVSVLTIVRKEGRDWRVRSTSTSR